MAFVWGRGGEAVSWGVAPIKLEGKGNRRNAGGAAVMRGLWRLAGGRWPKGGAACAALGQGALTPTRRPA